MKQHYIPRCYLRRFSDNDKSIYTYDKLHCKSYNANLMYKLNAYVNQVQPDASYVINSSF